MVARIKAGGLGLRSWGWAGFWLLLGSMLRVWQFNWYPLREDEAHYGYWARLIASGKDVMLERVAVDKPPFYLYTLARWFQWFGVSDASGRALNVVLSVLTMVVVGLLAWRIFGPRGGLWGLACFALSPFAISFAPTMYTDPMLTWWVMVALLAASYDLGLLAGLALGMGFATKQTGLLFIPLVGMALPLGHGLRARPWPWQRVWPWPRTRWLVELGLAGAGFAYLWHKVWQWDGWRILPAEIPDFWTQSWHSYGGLTWVAPWAWPSRVAVWWEVWRWWGGGLLGTLVWVGLALVAGWDAWQVVRGEASSKERLAAWWTWLFLGFSAGYLVLHVVIGFQPWDRYLLPLAPLSALVAAFLDETVPCYHGVIYQRWLGWQWDWYLWDRSDRVYWEDEEMLVEDVLKDRYGYARFVVFPGWHLDEVPKLEAALAQVGLHLEERMRVEDPATGAVKFLVFEIEPHIRW